jgi:membrane protease YdiL (CAAX protease family)
MSDRMEFWLVLIAAFGLPMYNSFAIAFRHAAHADARLVISDRSQLGSSAIQLAVLGFVFWISRVRDWSIRELGVRPGWRLTIIGILLFPALVIILLSVGAGIIMLVPNSVHHRPSVSIGLSFVGILATGIINPLFEEVLVCGYVIERLAKKGAGVAISFSAVVRFLCHVHLGVFSLGALVMGFAFGYLFWRYRQLWPLIIAHSLVDFLALLGPLLVAGKL